VTRDSDPCTERELAARVIDTLLREDYANLARRVRWHDGRPVLDLPVPDGRPGITLPLEPDGFLADFRICRAAGCAVPGPGCPPLTLSDVTAALTAVSDPRDSDGVAAFAAECRGALATLRLRERFLPVVWARLAAVPDRWSGTRGMLGYEALAAALPHPAYPSAESRRGFSDDDSLRYAPEFLPEFALRWVAIPRTRLSTAGQVHERPAGWPEPHDVGLPSSLAASHDLMPVHPVTARDQLAQALREAGLAESPGPAGEAGRAVIAPGACLPVTPTLSVRTVAVAGQPGSHLKVPLPVSTLGLRNHRFIKPGTLADGALVREVLATAARDDMELNCLLLADEGSYAHAGHPYLGYLLRRLPADLERCRIAPVAALLATHPRGPLVIDELAHWWGAGDARGLFGAYLRVLFGLHVRLFARYGIALEAHQQNTSLVLSEPGGPAPLRLLVKDFDGALIHLPRLASTLGPSTPGESAFDDRRLVTRSDDALADVFITITVHLCAGALAFGLARRGAAPLPELLAMVRQALTAALDRHAGWPAAAVLRTRVLEAGRLPGKSMVTAGTLVAKSRTGASDINKFYGTTGPNYLKRSCA
jgi:siderophore synthetase component